MIKAVYAQCAMNETCRQGKSDRGEANKSILVVVVKEDLKSVVREK